MPFDEKPVVFSCGSDQLLGAATLPGPPVTVGVLILAGGRQYRAGSHRLHVSLARRLASADIAAFRFDFRGMGDSSGDRRSFDQFDEDIEAALAAFHEVCPTLRHFVLWGLCDGATAAVLYCERRRDARVAGLCLVNPWIQSEQSAARTRLKHYYGSRVVAPGFWRKLLGGRLGLRQAVREYIGNWQRSRKPLDRPDYQRTMLAGLRRFPGPMLWLLAGNDLTAKEFQDELGDHGFQEIAERADITVAEVAGADHTFSSSSWQTEAEEQVCQWIAKLLVNRFDTV